MLPVLALGMKVYYYIALMVVILKYVVCLGRISLLGKILSFYFLTYSLREKKKKTKKHKRRQGDVTNNRLN